jgi:hypothetical protein
VTTNTDKPNLSTKDLWVGPCELEVTNRQSIDLTSNDDSCVSEGTEESSYKEDKSESEEDCEYSSDKSNKGGEFE